MTRPRIAILDDYTQAAMSSADWSGVVSRSDLDIFTDPLKDHDALTARLSPYDAIVAIRERTPFPRALLERLPRLKLLVTFGLVNRAIANDAAAELGIRVAGTASSSEAGSVELTWALILALSRQLVRNDGAMRAGGWQTALARELSGATLGVVGLGRLGSEVARIGLAFGMNVLAWSPNLTEARCASLGVTLASKNYLLRHSDIVTLHIVLSESTRGLIGAGDLALMKSSAYLVNTARGPLIDRTALIAALQDQRIAGAGLDVFDEEPLPSDDPLRRLSNVVLSPHMGFATQEGFRLHFARAAELLSNWLDTLGDARRPSSPTPAPSAL